MSGGGDVVAHVNYRRRNGRPQSEKDPETNKQIVQVAVNMMNARKHEDLNLQDHGFELRAQPTGMKRKDFFNDELVRTKFYPKCERTIKEATGAAAVQCFHHAVRGHGSGKPFAGIAHADYSVFTGQKLITSVGWGKAELKTPFKGRICVLNLWRNINEKSPIENHHLAMCEGSTVIAPDDFVDYDVIDDASGQLAHTYNLAPNNSRNHRWYYYPNMTGDEVLVFMQYDSDPRNRCRYTFHSSVSTKDASLQYNRESIEVRCVAYFPNEEYNTLPDSTLPVNMRVPAACDSIKDMINNLKGWDERGQRDAALKVHSNKMEGWFVDVCQHHKREQLRPEFKDLTSSDIQAVASTLASDRGWIASVKKLVDELCPYHGGTKERVGLAVDLLADAVHNLHHWDAKGKQWVQSCVSKDKVEDILRQLCELNKKKGLVPFTELTDAEIPKVLAGCMKRGLGDRIKKKAAGFA